MGERIIAMGTIIKEIEILGDKGRKKVKALFDSGSSDSLIRRDIVEGIATLIKRPEPLKFVLGDGKSIIKTEYFTVVDFVVKDAIFPAQRMAVVGELEGEVIFGADALQRWRMKLDMEHEDLIIDKSVLRFRV